MKKILIIIAVLLSITNAYCQKITCNKLTNNIRIVITDEFYLYNGLDKGCKMSLCRGCNKETGFQTLSISLQLQNYNNHIEENSSILFKLENEEIVKFTTTTGSTENKQHYAVTIGGNNFYNTIPLTEHIQFVSYNVTENDLIKLINGKPYKIRIEDVQGFFDTNINPEKFSKRLKKWYDKLNYTWDNCIPQDVTDGF